MSGRIALLIGTGRFNDASLPQLDTPAADVRDFAALLREPYVAGFDPIIELVDASTQQVGREIAHTLDRRQKDDLVVLYYSGHVVLDDEGRLHLAMVDTELDLLSPTSISAAFIAGEMDRCRSRRQVLILDCRVGIGFAHGAKSGANDVAPTESIAPLSLPQAQDVARAFQGDGYGRVIITACEDGFVEQPLNATANSPFTHGLLEGLRGAADADRDGRISLDELYEYAHAMFVRSMPSRPPSRFGDLSGSVLIGYAPARPSAPPRVSRPPTPGGLVSDRYRIVRPIDEGGRNMMFAAIDERSGRKVSVKCLRPPQSIDANALERFLREAQMAGAIDHPNVVSIYDVGFEGNSAFIVMEPLEGESLRALLRRTPKLDIGDALQILMPALAAVEAAHSHNVIHRALHPENIFVNRSPDGSIDGVKVLGFGVATVVDAGKKPPGGALIGSPHYMSPEQVLGGTRLDVRADVYSFGAILYEAFTGQRPFEAENHAAVLFKIGSGAVELPRKLNPELPERLEAIVLTALAHDPNKRYAEIELMRLALLDAASDHGWLPQPDPPPLIASKVTIRPSQPPLAPKIDTPAVFERMRRAPTRPRSWAWALTAIVASASAASWILSNANSEEIDRPVPDVVPIAQPPAARPNPPAPAPAPVVPDPVIPPKSAHVISPLGTAPGSSKLPPDLPPVPSGAVLMVREIDAGWIDPVPRSAAQAARESRAQRRRERERRKAGLSGHAGDAGIAPPAAPELKVGEAAPIQRLPAESR